MQACLCAQCEASVAMYASHCSSCQADPRLKGRYWFLERLGQGGSGITWKAMSEASRHIVCLKELRWTSLGNLEDERRFEREGAILTHLHHPAIPKFYEFFTDGKGRSLTHYISHEFIEGNTLEKERKTRGYTPQELIQMTAELAEILRYLHSRSPSLVHRDLKPSNVMRRSDGTLVLIDFGAARLDKLTHSQLSVSGTFGYMAPEQLRGESTPASDIYSLGMTIGVLASGAGPETLLTSSNRPDFRKLKQLPASLQQLLSQMCHELPEQRLSATQVIERCQKLLDLGALANQPARELSSSPLSESEISTKRVKRVMLLAMAIPLFVAAFKFFTISEEVSTSPVSDSDFQDTPIVPKQGSSSVDTGKSAQKSVQALDTPKPDSLPPLAVAPTQPKTAPPKPEPSGDIATACEEGDIDSCKVLIENADRPEFARRVPVPEHWQKSLVKACDRSIAIACNHLGDVYSKAFSPDKSPISARVFYGKACALEEFEACHDYGRMLMHGDGGPKDLAGAKVALKAACDARPLSQACYSYARVFEKEDPVHTRNLMTELCRANNVFACNHLTRAISNPKAMPKSAQEQLEVLGELCPIGICKACDLATSMLRAGKVVEKDPAYAYALDTKGCDKSCSNSCERLAQ